ncbi:LLM class flavin-dependent oxidoreductase [Nocardia uniformis]|uniref:LLM class flavin-dependent oxidoreductase n=1 Tax=Nocardia uniformis TaxID=53432 RepID=A0A849CD09_9NOCA|nr:LLM class flavin-dependent oxidoreductase [Nocardia uniformis]NNH75826.1 LLM class flavin-dependent oxidoreductase [Nocardia uniformis]
MTNLKIGVALPTMDECTAMGPTGIAQAARRAEAIGLDAVGASDVLLGDGTVALDPMIVLATAAAVTERIALEFGVLSVPTRPLAMLAAQAQTLQYLSGNRIRLGLGIGGFPGSPFWQALAAPERGRGQLLDTALDLLPALLEGKATAVPGLPEGATLALAPAVQVPPLLVGAGNSERVLRRIATRADGWITSAMTPADITTAATRLRELTTEAGRPMPRIHIGLHCVLGTRSEDEEDRASMNQTLGGFFEMSPEQVAAVTIVGTPEQAAARIAEYAEVGVDQLSVGFDGRDYFRQLDLLGQARALLPR